MPQTKYQIYELSARAVMSYGAEEDGVYAFRLDRRATERCRVASASHRQDGSALFFQAMCVLRGEDYREPEDALLISDLADVIFYMNFEGVFDRMSMVRQAERQRKAEDMFRPEGVTLDFGGGARRYLAFERSGNMSRQARLSFIREDVHDAVRRRIMLDMKIGLCQLTKLYAYNGLMLSGGARIDSVDIDRPGRVIVVDNEPRYVNNVPVITVEDLDGTGSIRRYRRIETRRDITVTAFDGEGLISKEYAAAIDRAYCGRHIHTSFQIRMPFVKGLLHQVDFKDFLKSSGTESITDIWGAVHPVEDVDVILTRSMFKGFGWLTENEMTWEDYWSAFRKYRHALYIVNVSKEKPERTTELNYQFLNTVSVRAEEFRPADLPDGWDHSPADEKRNWLTKETELAYYNFCADEQYRLDYFLEPLQRWGGFRKSREYRMAEILKKNPLFIYEPVYARALEKKAEAVLSNYAVGRLLVAGDNRFLSGDLLDFLKGLIDISHPHTNRQATFFNAAITNRLPDDAFLAPGAAYDHGDACTLLRNPHISRNEELQLYMYRKKDNMRKYYFGHLTDVVMVDAFMLAAERLGGADYDGDMVKTIADPILNECVKRNFVEEEQYRSHTNRDNMPLLMIPAAEPQLRDANDWHDRFVTVRDTFSSRVGQICNAALDRGIIAYNENSDGSDRKQCREEVETLAILTGLEIDAAKSGVRPDLSEYLNRRTVKRTPFLEYKNLVEASERRQAWYEPTRQTMLREFFRKTDWDKVDSNVERLPYLARKLKENTPRIKLKPAADSELFTFAQEEGWREKLDAGTLSAVASLLKDYEACLSRIRACRAPIKNQRRKTDIDRILYSRGQEERYDSDELYALFQQIVPERIAALRQAVRDRGWHLMDGSVRDSFLLEFLPELEEYHDFLADFRHGGYRILGDLVCDIDEENAGLERKKLTRETDSEAFAAMMQAYAENPFGGNYRQVVSGKCRELLERIVKPGLAVRYVVALDKRDLLWDLLLDQIGKNVLRREAADRAE